MKPQTSWAQELEKRILFRIKLVKVTAAYRIKIKGGRPSDQDSAALAALVALLGGASAASAIEQGVANGMRLMAYCHYKTPGNMDKLLTDIKNA
jgi:hypothetical protein